MKQREERRLATRVSSLRSQLLGHKYCSQPDQHIFPCWCSLSSSSQPDYPLYSYSFSLGRNPRQSDIFTSHLTSMDTMNLLTTNRHLLTNSQVGHLVNPNTVGQMVSPNPVGQMGNPNTIDQMGNPKQVGQEEREQQSNQPCACKECLVRIRFF